MKILLNNLPSVEDCKIYLDFGSGSVTSIGNHVFSYCKSLTSITIPNSVTSIGRKAFQNCTSLENIDIPDSVTSIDDNAFYSCSSLTSITIPDGVIKIGKYAFYNCTKLRTINYTGTEEHWNSISKGSDWNKYVPSDCQIVFNYVNG